MLSNLKPAKDAADAHLMLDFHGANKPSGMDRTRPNVLTREGVRGHEYQITGISAFSRLIMM